MPYNPFFQQRVTEAASILLSKSSGRMSYMKLIKLLYLADRKAYETWEHPITYDTYASLPKGPVGSSTLNLIKGIYPDRSYWDQFIETIGKEVRIKGEFPKIKKLSPADEKLLDQIYSEYGNYTQFELAEITEKLPEWNNPGKSSSPIELFDLLKKLKYNSEDIERITTEIHEKSTLDSIFN